MTKRFGVVGAMAFGILLGWACGGDIEGMLGGGGGGGVGSTGGGSGGPPDAAAQGGAPGAWTAIDCEPYESVVESPTQRNTTTSWIATADVDPSLYQAETCVVETLTTGIYASGADANHDGCNDSAPSGCDPRPTTECYYPPLSRSYDGSAMVWCGQTTRVETRASASDAWSLYGENGSRSAARIRRVF